jgi:hypothetical protein
MNVELVSLNIPVSESEGSYNGQQHEKILSKTYYSILYVLRLCSSSRKQEEKIPIYI